MRDGPPDPDPAGRLEALLRERPGVLVERWERLLLEDPGRTAAPLLRDQVTGLLDRLAARLARRGTPGEVARPPPCPDPPTPEELPAALGELALLRTAILEVCAAEGVRPDGEAAILVHAALDEAMVAVADAIVRRALAVAKLDRERLELTIELLPVGVFVADAGGRMLVINDAGRRIWGQQAPLAQSTSEYDAYRGYRPGGAGPIAAEDWALARVLCDPHRDAPVEDEFEMVAPGGERRTILNSALALRDAGGTITGGVAVNVDITDRKRTELRLAAILEGALDGIVLIDASGHVLEWNPAAARSFGYPRGEAIGRELAELIIEPALRDAHRRGLRHYLATGEGPIVGRRLELRAMRAGGELFDAELSVIGLPTGGPPVFAGFVRDISDCRQAERERAREAEFRERFIGILGHDLRTPLAAITFSAHALLGQATPGGAEALGLHRIVRSADRMARMIRDFLDFTRARQGGGIPVTLEPGDLAAICRHVLEEVTVSHPGRVVRLHVSGECSGRWDPDRMAQVVQNLVVNALDYSPADSEVAVTVEGVGDAVVLAVTNQGPPIPPERVADLWNPFRRGEHAPGEPAAKGLGLGLFIAHAIVGAHHGRIEVESDEARGTRFRVELPRSLPESSGGAGLRDHDGACPRPRP